MIFQAKKFYSRRIKLKITFDCSWHITKSGSDEKDDGTKLKHLLYTVAYGSVSSFTKQ